MESMTESVADVSGQAKKSSKVSWVERIEAAIANSGGQASLSAILHFIETRYTDVVGFGYDWKRTISFTLQGGEQFKKMGNDSGGVWRTCQPTEEVPPWEQNNMDLKRIIAEETKTRNERDRHRSKKLRRSHSPRRRSRSRNRSRSRSESRSRSRSRSRSSKRRRSSKRSDRGHARKESSTKKSKDDCTDKKLEQTKIDAETVLSASMGRDRLLEEFQTAFKETLEAQAKKDMASAMGSRESRPVKSGASTSEGKEQSSRTDAKAEQVPREAVALAATSPKSKEEEILGLYLKQHQQEKQQDVACHGDNDQYASGQEAMAGAGAYSAYGYYNYGYATDPSAWQQYQDQYAQWTAYYMSVGGMVMPNMIDESGGQTGEQGDAEAKKKSKKPTPEFWKAYKEKKRRKKASTRFNLKG